jgi:hypothetical protein
MSIGESSPASGKRPPAACREPVDQYSATAIPMSVVWTMILAVPISVVRAMIVSISVGWAPVTAHPLAAPPVRCPHATPTGAAVAATILIIRAIAVSVVRAMMISIKPLAVEPVRAGTLVSLDASIAGPTDLADMRPARAASALHAHATSAVSSSGSAQCRGACDKRRGRQTDYNLAHHDAHSIGSELHPSLSESIQ